MAAFHHELGQVPLHRLPRQPYSAPLGWSQGECWSLVAGSQHGPGKAQFVLILIARPLQLMQVGALRVSWTLPDWN